MRREIKRRALATTGFDRLLERIFIEFWLFRTNGTGDAYMNEIQEGEGLIGL